MCVTTLGGGGEEANAIRTPSKLLAVTGTYVSQLLFNCHNVPGRTKHTSFIFLVLKAGVTVCLADLHSSPEPKTKPEYSRPLALTGNKPPFFCVKQ